MKVKELIELLQQQDPEREVIMSCDEEGNRFGAFVELAKGTWNENDEEFHPENEDNIPAVALYPSM